MPQTDLFAKFESRLGPIGDYAEKAPGYFAFPKLEGELGNRMQFQGKEVIVWSLNNYLGLANHPEVRQADTDAAAAYGMAYPMGARMMSGNTAEHEKLESELADFVGTEDAMLFNFGYQGMVSAIDALAGRRDVIVYDAESHACIIDGLRLHPGKRFVFKHNDIADCEKQLERAKAIAGETGGGILLITEGVFGMSGNQGKVAEIAKLKEKYNFRLFVDDAHGFGTIGEKGAGVGEAQNCMGQIDIYFSTFAKSMASIGGFLAAGKKVLTYLRYNMRSQIFAKSLPMPIVLGNQKRLELLRNQPELKATLWRNVNMLQNGLREAGFDIGTTNSPVTPVRMAGGLYDAVQLIKDLRENYGIFCSVVVYPVIPKGQIILRLIPTAAHTEQDIKETLDAFRAVRSKIENKEYPQEMPSLS